MVSMRIQSRDREENGKRNTRRPDKRCLLGSGKGRERDKRWKSRHERRPTWEDRPKSTSSAKGTTEIWTPRSKFISGSPCRATTDRLVPCAFTPRRWWFMLPREPNQKLGEEGLWKGQWLLSWKGLLLKSFEQEAIEMWVNPCFRIKRTSDNWNHTIMARFANDEKRWGTWTWTDETIH